MNLNNPINEYFKFPLKNYSNLFILDGDDKMVFEYLIEETEDNTNDITDLCNYIVEIINGEKPTVTFTDNWSLVDDCIYYNNIPILQVRGWGYLNRVLNFRTQCVIDVQNDIIYNIYNKLSNYECNR